MFVQFRLFRPEYLKDVINITKNNLTERYNDFIFLDIQRSWPAGFILGMADNTVAGFICGGITGGREARILMIAVEKKYRRMGIGSGLITSFEKEAEKIKINKVKLEVRVDNTEAIEFYKSHGYAIVNLLPSYYNDGFDAYSMEKMLSRSDFL